MATTWNDARVDALKKLWADELTANEIAGRLGGVTRNAVIGKVHRLGLSGRNGTSRRKAHRPRALAPAGERVKQTRPAIGHTAFRRLLAAAPQPELPAAEELVIPMAARKYIHTLTASCCRWPIGDPKQAGFHFCGKTRAPGLPYCAFHARRAFQLPREQRRTHEPPAMEALARPGQHLAVADLDRGAP